MSSARHFLLVFRCAVFVKLLHLHPAVLEPDFNLSLREVEQPRHLVPAVPGQVGVEEELFLQLQDLVLGVRAALFSRGARVEPVRHRVI